MEGVKTLGDYKIIEVPDSYLEELGMERMDAPIYMPKGADQPVCARPRKISIVVDKEISDEEKLECLKEAIKAFNGKYFFSLLEVETVRLLRI